MLTFMRFSGSFFIGSPPFAGDRTRYSDQLATVRPGQWAGGATWLRCVMPLVGGGDSGGDADDGHGYPEDFGDDPKLAALSRDPAGLESEPLRQLHASQFGAFGGGQVELHAAVKD